MKGLFIILSLVLFSGFVPLREERGALVHRLIVQPDSKLIIDGKTNVNEYRCAILQYFGKDTLELREGGPNKRPVFTKGYVGLEASRFDCGMQVMTNDFWKTIKSEKYPFVGIEFISFERVPNYDQAKDIFKGRLQISLGGVTRKFEMNCTIEAQESGLIHLKGGRSFSFSDFNLEPPSKMMGLVKVKDSLDVNFHLVLLLDRDA